MSFWFGDKEKELREAYVQPFTPKLTVEEYRQVHFSDKFVCELYDSDRVLSNLHSYLVNMLMYARSKKSKKMILTESDLIFLCEIASKKNELKGS